MWGLPLAANVAPPATPAANVRLRLGGLLTPRPQGQIHALPTFKLEYGSISMFQSTPLAAGADEQPGCPVLAACPSTQRVPDTSLHVMKWGGFDSKFGLAACRRSEEE